MPQQLTLDLPLRQAFEREDYLVTPANAFALSVIEGWQSWPLAKAMLVGPEGSGKSHLAAIWCKMTGGKRLAPQEIVRANIDHLAVEPLALEDADQLQGPEGELALLHLHNLMVARQLPFLVTARTPPRDWSIALPDLMSRLEGTSLVRLDPPDDDLLRGVLAKLFTDRQIVVHGAVMDWLAARMTRSLSTAGRVVADLDARSLAEMTPVTRQMAADWLYNDLQGDLDL